MAKRSALATTIQKIIFLVKLSSFQRGRDVLVLASENLELTCIPKDTLTQFFLHNGHAVMDESQNIEHLFEYYGYSQ